MKILVLGSRGNLGVQLVKSFKDDFKLISFDKKDLDITDEKILNKKIKKIKPDIVINTVAYTAINESGTNEDYEKGKEINGKALGYLADACLDHNCILVHYSTDQVFDGKRLEGYKEDDKPNPVNRYGKTKFLGEQEIIKRIDRGLGFYLIRTSRLFGVSGESGVSKPSFFNHMLSQYAQATTKGHKELEAVDEEMACFTYTKDLAEETKKLLIDKSDFGIYHIINQGEATWYEGAKELFEVSNIDIEIKPITSEQLGDLAKKTNNSILLNTKIKPLRHWKDALREYIG